MVDKFCDMLFNTTFKNEKEMKIQSIFTELKISNYKKRKIIADYDECHKKI